MGFCAAFTSAIHAVARPSLIVPAGFVAVFALLSPPAIEDASAQSFRMQGPRGFSGGGPGRFQMSGGMMSAGMMSKGMPSGMSGPRRPGGNNTVAGTGGMGGMGGMGMGGGGRHPGGNTIGDGRPKGDRYPPRRPRFPIPPFYPPGDTVVSVPGGPPSSPPPNFSGGGGGGGGGGGQPPQQPPVTSGRYVPNEVLVEVAGNVSPQTMAALMRRHRLTQLESINLQFTNTSIRRLRINDRRPAPTVVRALASEGFTVQLNQIVSLHQASTAPATSGCDLDQYAMARMRMPEAHELANGHRVLIAVIDGGVDTQHPELAGLIVDTYDAIGHGDRIHAHGTSIVGAIAARARLRGTAPGVHILAARAFGTRHTSMDGTTSDIVKAIEWSMQRGARIINMSFAGDRNALIERHLNVARARGIILVAAAGNNGPTAPPQYPAALPAVIAVTATDEDDRLYRSAVRGNHIAIAAPGVNLVLPTVGGDCRITSGTSFSAAEIAGVIALMLERNPSLTPDAVRRALISTARDLGAPGMDPLFGAGLVDAHRAVMSVMPAAPEANAAPAAPVTPASTAGQASQ
jgi:hypothetical protein